MKLPKKLLTENFLPICIPLYSVSEPRLWFKVEKATGKWASALYFACVRLIVLVWYPKLLKIFRFEFDSVNQFYAVQRGGF